MSRPFLSAAALAAAALVSPGAAAQSGNANWTVDFDDEIGACWMQQEFNLDGGVTSSLTVDLPWDEDPLLIMRNSTWTMAEGDTSAEIWFSGDWQRTPDATASARFHQADGITHVDVFISYDLVERMGRTETLTVRVSGGPFERYAMGPTGGAVEDLLECDYWAF